jgi:hypothetical protein
MDLLLTSLTGGLAGAVITLVTQNSLRHWNRPMLEIGCDDEGCDVRTRAVRTDLSGNPPVEQHYLRLRITNKGKNFARNVSGCITSISYRDDRAGSKTVFKAEVVDLKLALTTDRAIFDLAAGGHRFVDLVYCLQETGNPNHLYFDFVKTPSNLLFQGYGNGKYEMKVFVAADNAQSVSNDFGWSWDGALEGLKFTGKGP